MHCYCSLGRTAAVRSKMAGKGKGRQCSRWDRSGGRSHRNRFQGCKGCTQHHFLHRRTSHQRHGYKSLSKDNRRREAQDAVLARSAGPVAVMGQSGMDTGSTIGSLCWGPSAPRASHCFDSNRMGLAEDRMTQRRARRREGKRANRALRTAVHGKIRAGEQAACCEPATR